MILESVRKYNRGRTFSTFPKIFAELIVVNSPVLIMQSLKLHVLKLTKNIDDLKLQLVSSTHTFFWCQFF